MRFHDPIKKIFSRYLSVMTFADAFTSAAIALFVGAIAGGAVGWCCESYLEGESYQELAFVCGLISAMLGAFGGAVAGMLARVSGQPLGLAVAVTVPFLIWFAIVASPRGVHQVAVVWLAAMMTGSVACLYMNQGVRKKRHA